jgi:hypothetical protein
MNNDVDLRGLLDAWPYDPEHNVRIVRGTDGRELLQVRLCLGLEQYEMEGRPDGKRPYGKLSVLEHFAESLAEARRRGKESEFALTPEQCAELFAEGMLYYYRYLNLFQARYWPGTLRDTSRNLKLFDFVRRYAEREEDRNYLEQWRPYIVRINATAAAMIQLEGGAHQAALDLLQQAISRIKSLPESEDQTYQFERKRSLLTLGELVQQIKRGRPVPLRERLERELRRAIERQEFERAAALRDQIRALSQPSADPPRA